MTSDRPSYRLSPGQTEDMVRQLLTEIADRLATNRPDAPFTGTSRIAALQAATMSPPLSEALRARCPEPTEPTTRGAYARLLRALVAELAEAGRRTAQACANCAQPFTPDTTQPSVAARYGDTPWCHGCLTHCEASTGHVCPLCVHTPAANPPAHTEPTRQERVAALHREADDDYQKAALQRERLAHRDDAHLIASAAEAAAAHPDLDLDDTERGEGQ